ncbi:isoleucine--tRNA ligase [Coprobacillus sp. CAG:698]|nr:isoleucine--tRNA ligase [Coprobacillus sp. CAG:698]
MYNKVPTDLKFIEREKKVEKFWKDNDIFQKSIVIHKNDKNYTFFDGPPTANGKPHIGHVLTRVIKDMIPRYQAMKGHRILRKAGWDTHGLPVELEVEKQLGLDGKEQIEKYGLEPFIKKCKESVWKYKGMWEDFSSTVGFWADMDNPYITYDNNYIESVWWSLKKIWDKGLLYKGFKVVPYCPRCGTPLSSHEVAQGYKDVKDKTAICKFKCKDEDNTYYLAWTTTPWTLPSNLALCVNQDETYVKVKTINEKLGKEEHYILAKALLSVLDGEYEIEKEFLGKELEYREYEPLFDFKKLDKKHYYVVCDSYVTLTDGTGIVHIAPAFGEDDARVGRKYDLPFLQLVNSKGEMTEETPWAGMFCKKADKEVLLALDKENKLFKVLNYEHSYPHCWRCDTPLIYYARESWFIKMTAVRDDLVKNNNTINWIPESIGKGRFGDWISNVQDWGISRDRYWGTPLPVWECECGHRHAIGSIAELKEMSNNCPDNIELHRPYIDAVTIKCPKCGKEMHRVKEVIDCWYDSGSMPFAQWHYPFENEEIFKENFPADFISEAVDQTRGWFYSLLAISTLIFNEAPFKNVIVLGHVQDENGQKMSKSKGNAVDPFDALKEFGADAIRWYFYSNSAPWLPNRFHSKAVVEGQRKVMGTLWNTYAFYVLYANIDEFDPTKYTLDYDKLTVMDKWIISKLNTLVKDVDTCLGQYKIFECTKTIETFIDDLSNWYVRRSRERFWAKGMEQDKINAYMTLYTSLVTLCKAICPMLPFITEEIYQNLVRSVNKEAPESIHLCSYPEVNEKYINKELENKMDEVLDIVVLGRNARNSGNVKNRQPIATMYVLGEKLDDLYLDIIKDELNVKEVEFVSDVSKYTTYKFKPNFNTLRAKYGKLLGFISKELQTIDGHKTMEELNTNGKITLTINGENVELEKEDLLIETFKTEGYSVAFDKGLYVVLDTKLTPELIEEGYVREIVSKVQTMRKDAGFEVVDHIYFFVTGNENIKKIIENNETEIKKDLLAEEIVFDRLEENIFTKEWNINGEDVTFAVKKF